jgi:hypothetical protein
MEEWFYVKNDLKTREDIKEIIMCPIWSRFGLRRPKLMTPPKRFRVWPLVESWEMPKETITNSSEGGLVRLKYTFRFGISLMNQMMIG